MRIREQINLVTLQLYPWMYTLRNASLVLGLYLGQYYG